MRGLILTLVWFCGGVLATSLLADMMKARSIAAGAERQARERAVLDARLPDDLVTVSGRSRVPAR